MSIETEVKLKVSDLEAVRRRLRQLGATRVYRCVEDNRYFDRPDQCLRQADRSLRIRSYVARDEPNGSPATLTFKGPRRVNGAIKSREELEIGLSDPDTAEHILSALGYRHTLQFEKERESWRLGTCRVELDSIPALGTFVEIEGPDAMTIHNTRTRLELNSVPALSYTYAAMVSQRPVAVHASKASDPCGAIDRSSKLACGSRGVSLAPVLAHLRSSLSAVRTDADPEDLHEVRVLCGRIRVWLAMAGSRPLDDDVRWLRRSAAELRNIDVLLASDVSETFRSWLQTQRPRAREAVLATLETPRTAALLEALSLLPSLPMSRARSAVPNLAQRVIKQARCLRHACASIEKLHNLRRRLRRLRYALEWLGQKPKAIKSMQDALGTLGDLQVADDHYRCWPERGRYPDIADTIASDIAHARRDVRRAWPRARRKLRKLAHDRYQ